VAGALGSDEDNVDIGGNLDEAEMDRETVRENEGLALLQVGLDVGFVDIGLLHIGQADKNDVGESDGLGRGDDLEAVLLGDWLGLRTLVEADDHIYAGVFEIQGVGMALGTVAENGNGLVLVEAEIGVLVGVYFGRHVGKNI